MTTHQRLHAVDKPYSCEICNKSYLSSSNLSWHFKSVKHKKKEGKSKDFSSKQDNFVDICEFDKEDRTIKTTFIPDVKKEETIYFDDIKEEAFDEENIKQKIILEEDNISIEITKLEEFEEGSHIKEENIKEEI